MGAVFINYRGDDSRSYGALLYTELSHQFGRELVFLDCESIPAGTDFVPHLLGQVRSAQVVLAVIGPHWLSARTAAGTRRIDDPEDWIRRELAEAFAAGVRVIPVLADDARLPAAAELPPDIAVLSRCQYRRLRHHDASGDLARIVADLAAGHPDLVAARRRRQPVPPEPVPARKRDEASSRPRPRSRSRMFDRYRWRSRTGPLLLTALPATSLVFALLPLLDAVKWALVLLVAGGLPILTDQLARARGKSIEPQLFERWGGKPTTQLLRWAGPTPPTRQAHQRCSLQRMLGSSLSLPSAEQEAADPQAADEAYEAAVAVLRVAERGRASLAFEENCNYGFRRNMLGLRPYGLAVTLLSLLVSTLLLLLGAPVPPALAIAAGDVLLLSLWLAVVRPAWVEQAAWAYAERLLEAALRPSLLAASAPEHD